MRKRAALVVVVLALVGFAAARLQAGPPGEISIQARLTDATGKPILDGEVDRVTFKLFATTAPVGSWIWGEVHRRVTVSRGIVSVRLGAGDDTVNPDGTTSSGASSLTPALFDGPTKYLQIAINGEPPLPQLVPLVSVPYALTAGSLNGRTESQITPIGTVVEWFRPSPATPVPDGWEVCDGHTCSDTRSPFNGFAVPALVGRFTRGLSPTQMTATSYGAGTASPLPDQGGSDSFSFNQSHSHNVGSHSHSISTDGGHGHSANLGDSSGHFVGGNLQNHGGITGPYFVPTGPGPNCLHGAPVTVQSVGGHSHGGQTGQASGSTDSVNIGFSMDNRPSYVGLLKIIRVR